MQKLNKKSVQADLIELHAVCEANYVRLLRLFPDYENCNARELLVGSAKVRLNVVERCRYTTIFQLHQQRGESRWLGLLRIEVRAYHDAVCWKWACFSPIGRWLPVTTTPMSKCSRRMRSTSKTAFWRIGWNTACKMDVPISMSVRP